MSNDRHRQVRLCDEPYCNEHCQILLGFLYSQDVEGKLAGKGRELSEEEREELK